MKTVLITLLLAVVVLLGPPMMVTGESAVAVNNQSTLNIAHPDHATAQPLSRAEMNAAVGGGITGCFQSIDGSGDVYGTCCVNLWIFTICVSVNESAIERAISSLF